MIRSILRAIWRRRKHQANALQCGLQRLGALQARSQMSGCYDLVSNATTSHRYDGASNQLNDYYASGLNGVSGGKIEIDKRRVGVANNFDAWVRCNLFGHRHPPSLKVRFHRSCRAFVNAWRAAA